MVVSEAASISSRSLLQATATAVRGGGRGGSRSRGRSSRPKSSNSVIQHHLHLASTTAADILKFGTSLVGSHVESLAVLRLGRRLSSQAAEAAAGEGGTAGKGLRGGGSGDVSRGTDREGLERAAVFSIRGSALGVAHL